MNGLKLHSTILFCTKCKDYKRCDAVIYDSDGNEMEDQPRCESCGNTDIRTNEQLLFEVNTLDGDVAFVYLNDEAKVYEVFRDWDMDGVIRTVEQDIDTITSWIKLNYNCITPKQRDLLISLV